MSINRCISSGSSESLAFPIFDMLSLGTHKLLGQSKINDEDSMSISSGPFSITKRPENSNNQICTYGEIVRFDIPVDDSPGMDIFNSLDHLIGQHEDRFS